MPSTMLPCRTLVAAVLLRAAAAIKVMEDMEELAQNVAQGEAEGKAVHELMPPPKEAEDRPLSRKERAIAERIARRKEAWKAAGRPLSRKERAIAERDARRQGAKEAERKAKAADVKIMEDPGDLRHKNRPVPQPTPSPPTAAPTPDPTPAPTPEPTAVSELNGVPCACLNGECFRRYDRDGDGLISYDECNLQWPLAGNCSAAAADYGPTVWDPDQDGFISPTEWDAIFTATDGAVCPLEPVSYCPECPEGFIVEASPCGCSPCVGGEVRRRRSLECTPCPAPFIDRGDFDDCMDPSTPSLSTASNGSSNITVHIPYQTCDEFSLGDSISISGEVGGAVVTHTTIVIGITPVVGGFVYDLHDKLPADFQVDATVRQQCTTTDGTQVSAKFSSSSNGCCCDCGTACCESTEVCTIHPNGTGVCSLPGPYPAFSTPAPTVGAKGDPHLVNLQGEHFDINHEGKFTLLRFPQAEEKPTEFSFQAFIQADVGKPCTTYITRVELSGAWLGNKSVQIRCYRRSHSNDTDAFLGARLLEGEFESPWQAIEKFQSKDMVLSDSESDFEVSLGTAAWFPKKWSKKGPTAAGMFTLSMRNKKHSSSAKITMRQDLPGQEHLNVAMRQLSQLGRVDVGGLLGFDAHPESLERPSAACAHHRATARYRIESQDEADHGYYFRPTWKDRWDKVRTAGRSRDNEASSSLVRKIDGQQASGLDSMMCKCPSNDVGPGSSEGVLVEEASFVFAQASWE